MSNHRTPQNPAVNENKGVDKKVRRKIGAQIKMDMQPYIDLYPDKALMVVNDLDGDLQRWLDAGAEPIPTARKDRATYEGLNDKAATQWVRFVGGQFGNGETYYTYGLMMNKDLYDEYKHSPQRDRHEEVKRAMFGGQSSQDGSLSSGQSIKSYAANLPTGDGVGYNQVRLNK